MVFIARCIKNCTLPRGMTSTEIVREDQEVRLPVEAWDEARYPFLKHFACIEARPGEDQPPADPSIWKLHPAWKKITGPVKGRPEDPEPDGVDSEIRNPPQAEPARVDSGFNSPPRARNRSRHQIRRQGWDRSID